MYVEALLNKATAGATDRRRSQRVMLSLPVVAKELGKDRSIEEATETLVVSEKGCLVKLKTPVERESRLRLVNVQTSQTVLCKVAYLGQHQPDGKIEVGLEFVDANPRFWQVAFPPKDWNPEDRKRPTRASER